MDFFSQYGQEDNFLQYIEQVSLKGMKNIELLSKSLNYDEQQVKSIISKIKDRRILDSDFIKIKGYYELFGTKFVDIPYEAYSDKVYDAISLIMKCTKNEYFENYEKYMVERYNTINAIYSQLIEKYNEMGSKDIEKPIKPLLNKNKVPKKIPEELEIKKYIDENIEKIEIYKELLNYYKKDLNKYNKDLKEFEEFQKNKAMFSEYEIDIDYLIAVIKNLNIYDSDLTSKEKIIEIIMKLYNAIKEDGQKFTSHIRKTSNSKINEKEKISNKKKDTEDEIIYEKFNPNYEYIINEFISKNLNNLSNKNKKNIDEMLKKLISCNIESIIIKKLMYNINEFNIEETKKKIDLIIKFSESLGNNESILIDLDKYFSLVDSNKYDVEALKQLNLIEKKLKEQESGLYLPDNIYKCSYKYLLKLIELTNENYRELINLPNELYLDCIKEQEQELYEHYKEYKRNIKNYKGFYFTEVDRILYKLVKQIFSDKYRTKIDFISSDILLNLSGLEIIDCKKNDILVSILREIAGNTYKFSELNSTSSIHDLNGRINIISKRIFNAIRNSVEHDSERNSHEEYGIRFDHEYIYFQNNNNGQTFFEAKIRKIDMIMFLGSLLETIRENENSYNTMLPTNQFKIECNNIENYKNSEKVHNTLKVVNSVVDKFKTEIELFNTLKEKFVIDFNVYTINNIREQLKNSNAYLNYNNIIMFNGSEEMDEYEELARSFRINHNNQGIAYIDEKLNIHYICKINNKIEKGTINKNHRNLNNYTNEMIEKKPKYITNYKLFRDDNNQIQMEFLDPITNIKMTTVNLNNNNIHGTFYVKYYDNIENQYREKEYGTITQDSHIGSIIEMKEKLKEINFIDLTIMSDDEKKFHIRFKDPISNIIMSSTVTSNTDLKKGDFSVSYFNYTTNYCNILNNSEDIEACNKFLENIEKISKPIEYIYYATESVFKVKIEHITYRINYSDIKKVQLLYQQYKNWDFNPTIEISNNQIEIKINNVLVKDTTILDNNKDFLKKLQELKKIFPSIGIINPTLRKNGEKIELWYKISDYEILNKNLKKIIDNNEKIMKSIESSKILRDNIIPLLKEKDKQMELRYKVYGNEVSEEELSEIISNIKMVEGILNKNNYTITKLNIHNNIYDVEFGDNIVLRLTTNMLKKLKNLSATREKIENDFGKIDQIYFPNINELKVLISSTEFDYDEDIACYINPITNAQNNNLPSRVK